jgi:hypothetical protein
MSTAEPGNDAIAILLAGADDDSFESFARAMEAVCDGLEAMADLFGRADALGIYPQI